MRRIETLVLFAALGACSSGPAPVACKTDNECSAAANRPVCDAATSTCAKGTARATLIGTGDGSAASVTLTVAFEPDRPRTPTGMAFNPQRPDELWIVNHMDDSVVIVSGFGSPQATSKRKHDPDAGHFMHMPTGIAFAGDDTWATCGESDNSQNGNTGFMGPAAFSADPAIFATQNPTTTLGSHLDMLHASPFCMGIAHERDHAYWVFDGENSALVRYDFHDFHPPGEEDHSDGEIHFYATGSVKRVEGVPSHLVFNADDGFLYAADTGNQRIVKLDTSSGTPGDELPSLEPSIPVQMNNTAVVEVVPMGTLQAPSGMLMQQGVLYVTDNANSTVYAFDTSGRLLRSLATGLVAGSLGDLTIGPDGKLHLLDMVSGRVYSIDPLPTTMM